MFLIALFPWLAGLLMQAPYGYLFAVGMWAGICGFLMLIAAVLPLIAIGETIGENKLMPSILVSIYFCILCAVLT